MQELEKLTETSSITTYKVNTKQTVASILEALGLQQKYFAVLVNGRKVNLQDVLEEGQEIIVLPKIAGG